MKKYKLISILLSSVILLPTIAFAASLIPCDGVTKVCDFNAFMTMINGFITRFLELSVVIAAVTFSIGGAKILLNPGNPTERQKAMEMFKKTVIGMLIVLGAWLIVHTIVTAVARDPNSALRFLGK
jgi:hypothetical protein